MHLARGVSRMCHVCVVFMTTDTFVFMCPAMQGVRDGTLP